MATDDHGWLVTAALTASSLISAAANLLLLLVFSRRRGLRTVPNRFVINLLVTNLLSSALLIPFLAADRLDERKDDGFLGGIFEEEEDEDEEAAAIVSGDDVEIVETRTRIVAAAYRNDSSATDAIMCHLAQSATSVACTASILSVLLIGVNQYFAVVHSLRYHFYINKCRSMALVAGSWFVALVFGFLRALTQDDSGLWGFCGDGSGSRPLVRALNTAYALLFFGAVVMLPFIAITAIYAKIYRAAHMNSERMRRSTSGSCSGNLDAYVQVPSKISKAPSSETLDAEVASAAGRGRRTLVKVHSAPNFITLERNGDAANHRARQAVARTCSDRAPSNFITSIKWKISSATVFRYREETRAAKISVLVIFMVLTCYVPYGVLLVLNTQLVGLETSRAANRVALALLASSNIISPFLFAYRNRRIQRELCKVFGCARERSTAAATTRVRDAATADKPERLFLTGDGGDNVPKVVVTCQQQPQCAKKSILKRVCSGGSWPNYKKCSFITVPDSCLSGDARGSFSSASTQVSTED